MLTRAFWRRLFRRPCPVCRDWKLFHYRTPIDDAFRLADKCAGCAVLAAIFTSYKNEFPKCKRFETNVDEEGRMEFLILEENTLFHSLHVFTSSDSTCPFPRIERGPFISGNTGSEEAVAKITQWLGTCVDSHMSCNHNSQPTQLPTRVLEIQGPRTVRLHATTNQEEETRYICLSHCWGKEPCIKTTTSTLPIYLHAIPWNELPRTFQEAIDVTYRLGIKYLWIDSLCIVQDDKDDWRHEGSKMASIYSQSYLTIAASKSSSSSGGCFSIPGPAYIERTFEFWNTNNDKYTIHARKLLDHVTHGSTVSFPLLGRAWVLQERLLSPRMVHFGPQELSWECKEMQTCECGRLSGEYVSGHSKTKIMAISASNLPERGIWHPQDKWHAVVEEYSIKDISVETDVFPALQGVAKYLQQERNCAYYAGLWEDNLVQDLLWYCTNPSKSRPCQWRAPTWSWASVRGGVEWDRWYTDWKVHVLASVIAISTTPVGSDPFGELEGGELKLKGCCISARIFEDSGDSGTPGGFRRHCLTIKTSVGHIVLTGRSDANEFYPDYDLSSHSGAFVSIMEVMKDRGSYRFLVFVCVNEEQQVFERVGHVICEKANAKELLAYFKQHGKDVVLTVV